MSKPSLKGKLLPCPLCNVDGEQLFELMVICDINDLDEDTARGTWVVSCGNCGCIVPSSTNSWRTPDAEERWNNQPLRTKIATLTAEADKLLPDSCLYHMGD